jgi:dUTP pyrophosphatase
MIMTIGIKYSLHHELAVAPSYANSTDGAMDLTAVSAEATDRYIEYDTGVKLAIPAGYVGLVFPRSSISNIALILSNSVGVIDHNYSGTIKFRFRGLGNPNVYQVGDRIGQILVIPRPQIELELIEDVADINTRDGFGSTGA